MPAQGSRRSRRPRSDRDDASHRAAKRIAAIDRAFDAAVSGPSLTTGKARRSAGRAVVPDDEDGEEEDETMLEAVDIAPSEQPDADQKGGGLMLDAEERAHDMADGGGFFPEPEAVAPFSTNANGSGGGGFLLPQDTSMDGGFLPDPNNVPPSENTYQGGGGFLVDEAGADSEQLAGGSLPEMDALPDYSNEGGGFLSLPEVPQQFLGAEPSASDLLPLPDPNAPPPRDRIALTAIPAALRSLGLHQIGLQGAEVMALFEEVASDDEEAEGGKSVQRERFKEACQVLLGSDDEDDDDAPDSEDQAEHRQAAGEDEDDFTGPGRRRLRRGGADAATARGALKEEEPTRVQPKRRSARSKPAAAVDGGVDAAGNAPILDALPADFEEDDESSFESESDAEDQSTGKGKKGSSKAQPNKGKRGRRIAIDPSQPLSQEDLAAASDTYDLFFEESPQLPFAQKDRQISLLELQRACRVLKEKMTDGDLNEMLEYAARGRGSVNLDAFARILLETGL